MKEIRSTMAVELYQSSLLNQEGSVFFDDRDLPDVPPDDDSISSNLFPVNSDLLSITQVVLICATVCV